MIRSAVLRISVTAALFSSFVTVAHAATPAALVRDVRRDAGPNLSSDPSSMISLGDRALFWARTRLLGNELYRTDGTAAGTSLVADICPGLCGSIVAPPVAVGGRAYFLGPDGMRRLTKLWTSDGTVGGTRPLLDFAQEEFRGFQPSLLDGGDRLLFEPGIPTSIGHDFWSSDGTVAGTVRFAHLADGPEGGILIPGEAAPGGPLPGGRRLYVESFNQTGFIDEIWESDGTAAGTRRVLALPATGTEYLCSYDFPQVVAGDFYFAVATPATGCELWRVANGVAAPFADLRAGAASSDPHSFVRQGDWTLFVADRSDEEERVLWTTDGTLERTLPAAPAGPSAGTSPDYLGSNSARAYFAAETPEEGIELWVTEGPPGTFRRLRDFVLGAGSSHPRPAGVAGNRVFFWTFHPDRGVELQAASPGGVRSVARVPRFEDNLARFAAVGERAVFAADLGLGVGVELAVTNGLPEGTRLLRALGQGDPSSYPKQLTRVAGRLLFTATDDTHGEEVWRTDATTAGTELVADLTPGSEASYFPFFLAPTASGVVLGAPDGSIRHAQARSGGIDLLSFPRNRDTTPGFRLDGKAFFFSSTERIELWRADGRPEGVQRLAEFSGFEPADGYFVLSAVDPERHRAFLIPAMIDRWGDPVPSGLWITDGTVAGTRRVLGESCDFCGSAYISEGVIGPDGRFFFAIDYGGGLSRLWTSDGTRSGTMALFESQSFHGEIIRSVARLGELILFSAFDLEHGDELWVSDGTAAGTHLLADLRPGTAPSWPDGITVVGDRAFFSADDGETGRELWATDGTEEGTYRVADLRPGPRSSVPQALTAIGERLVFAADDGKHGLEVWSSDGTAAGTRLASDVQVGRLPSTPGDFLVLGSDLLFVASRLTTGRELFRLPLAALDAP